MNLYKHYDHVLCGIQCMQVIIKTWKKFAITENFKLVCIDFAIKGGVVVFGKHIFVPSRTPVGQLHWEVFTYT